MDGVVAYILGKSYTKKSLIGIGALAGAPCQVQSINKEDKTTTITLKWEDNEGGVHTQSFEILDGEDGVSVSNATINPNGHLILTLSDGNNIDCGQVLPQYDTMPLPSASNLGQILQYIGNTTPNYTNGYFYQCINDGGVYKWIEKPIQDSYSKTEIGNLSNLPDNTKNVIENIETLKLSIDQLQASKLSISDIDDALSDSSENPVQNKVIKLTIDQLRGSILDLLNDKEDRFRYAIMPTANSDNVDKIVEYIGNTTATYINGYFYQCRFDGTNYSWVQKNIQPSNGGGGGDGVIDGYYNSADQLFYEEDTFINPIVGDSNTLYVSLDNNLVYRFDDPIFIRVDDSGGVVNGYYNVLNGKFYEDSTYTTEIVGELDKIYISIDTNIQYRWDGTQFITISSSITVDDELSDTSENPVQNKVIKLALDQIKASMLTPQQKEKLIKLSPIYLVGSGLNLDPITGELRASGIDVPIDDHLSNTSLNPVQNKVITEKINNLDVLMATKLSINDVDSVLSATSLNPVQNKVIKLTIDQIQGSILTKIQKKLAAQEDDFAIFTNDGDIKDSGISKNIVPSTASINNKLLVATDLSIKADKVSSATNDDFATLDANGNLKDSGINKNIVPSSATSSNKLATIADIPDELNDLNDVVITTPVNSQILAYNSTSGKWENKTGQETIGGLVFKGSILFANLPTTGMSNGDAYDIKDAFTTDNRFEEGSGIACGAGTDIVWVASENKWNILTPSGVYSFNGRTGAVAPATSDYDADQIDYDNTTSGLTATNVQDGIDELSSEKADKVDSATSGHLAGLDGNGNLTDSGIASNKVIQKVTTATGLLRDDGSVDSTEYASSANAYLINDTTENDINDSDYFPFYDSSATGKRKTLWSNIKSKLKTYFDGLYTNIVSASTEGNFASFTSTGNITDSGKKATDFASANDLNNKSNKPSSATTIDDIATFIDANGNLKDSGVSINSLPTIAPTPSSSLVENDIVNQVNGAINTNSNSPSLYGVQKWSNEKKVRRVLDGSNIPSGTSMTATGIGTWDDSSTPDETDWWYDDAFKLPNDADDIDLSFKFDPSGNVVVLGGYIVDTTTGKICIKFGNSVTISNTRIAVDITYTRNEVS